ncbi:MAG TPA: uroporphyrinogen-III C-methyltransferase [Syntrophales bacterium]|nr:uroporphyrinogen-III C-methyltransferase [Syntrophales bacterium]HOL59423.1 uroporphyrinogen-III C-methyltransferase [Syntrophales bacterium]HPO35580.1 uroporphyrinogen-III C-methyltransferase [Syntrophales bacterium]
MKSKGKVYLVGAGPGDPELITVKGMKCLKEADVVVYDHLVADEILNLCRPEARLIYAGKSGSDHTLAQEEINHLLVQEAKKGLTVVRLKGGDPFIFGRGGEEALVLEEAGIPFEVICGVTSAIAVPAYAGIPLTHRGYTSSLAIVTGHEDPTKGDSAIDWPALARTGTIVFLMGVKNLPRITEELLHAGMDPQTPTALIRCGTTPEQETLVSDLKNIAARSQEEKIQPPAILVVGKVVSLRKALNWFERLPLFGRGIVITRPQDQSEEIRQMLKNLGARVYLFPTIAIEPPESWEACDHALEQLGNYRWIIFTSVNGVAFFFRRLAMKGRDGRDLKGTQLAAIGPATAKAIEAKGLHVDLCPPEFTSEGLLAALKETEVRGADILLPRAMEAREILPAELTHRGAQVHEVPVYRTVNARPDPDRLVGWIEKGKVSCITFTSPSTIKYFREIMGPEFMLPPSVKVAVIGPITKAYAEKCGFEVHIQGEPYTTEGLVKNLVHYFVAEQ